MEQTVRDNLITVNHWLKLGNVERAKEEAEWMIEEDSEDASGYLCLAYVYFYGLQEEGESIFYLEEALRLNHIDETVLLVALEISDSQQAIDKIRELAEIGMKNYTENAVFYYYMAHAYLLLETPKQSLPYYEKAIELDPENELYIGRYALILYYYFPKRKQDALRAEERALELNPENVMNLVAFADYAKEQRQFKKARMLAETAMKLEPNHPGVQKIYKETIVTKNKFCHFTMNLSILIVPLAKFINLFRFIEGKSPSFFNILVYISSVIYFIIPIVFLEEYALVLYGALFGMSFISGKIQDRMLRNLGLSDKRSGEYNTQKNKRKRDKEISKMMRNSHSKKNITTENTNVSEEELQLQLEQLWGPGASVEKSKEALPQQKLSEKERKDVKGYSRLKSSPYKGWIIFIVTVLLIRIIYSGIKYYQIHENANQDQEIKVSEEIKDVTVEYNSEELKVGMEKTEMYIISMTFSVFKQSDGSEESLRESVEENYIATVLEKTGQPSFESLKAARIMKLYKENGNLYVLLRSSDRSRFVLEMSPSKIKRIYGETWDNSEVEMQIHNELVKKLERQGTEPNVAGL
ncbi:hypothetical protein BAMA_08055 [Bacillus manliponensis]|uniref:Uncharacterized protein n=1 Tax=Bacillus manliponensis TaxID=574376 RepID=A0A073JSE4_9BACI|nr:hypothetical protein [Bacillus manliponensis]KEK17974.1 hypothetical protein BAMA_08055 [Bacillus manliponensis]